MIKGIVPTTASICTGVGGLSLGFERAGFLPLWFCEIDRQCREVLRKHWATVPIYHDMLGLDLENIKRPDILEISAPCQSFSQAGLRGSLDDARGNLTLASIKIADKINPQYVIFENVPGILSTVDNAFGCFIGGLAGCDAPLIPPTTIPRWKTGTSGRYFSWPNAGVVTGPKRCVAWRVLDTQFFNCAQRRERVFVVASAGTLGAIDVLFERKSSGWNHPQGRGAWEDIAPTLERSAGSRGIGTDFECNGGLQIANTLRGQGPGTGRIGDSRGNDNVVLQQHATNDKEWPKKVADTLTHAYADKQGLENQHIDGGAGLYVAAIRTAQTSSNGWGIDESGSSYPLDGAQGQVIAFDTTQITSKVNGSNPQPGDACHPLAAKGHPPAIAFRTSGNCGPFDQGDKTAALNTATDPNQNIICFEPGVMSREGGHQYGDLSGTIRSHAGDNQMSVAGNFGVRRLTPRECEILQSWPPDWTRYAVSEKTGEIYEQTDAPRYRQAGNGVTSNVAEFIARRIKPFIK